MIGIPYVVGTISGISIPWVRNLKVRRAASSPLVAFTIAGVVVVIVLTMIRVCVVAHDDHSAEGDLAACTGQMVEIGQAIARFQADHNGRFPRSLAELGAGHYLLANDLPGRSAILRCPAVVSGRAARHMPDPRNLPDDGQYLYVAPDLSTDLSVQVILIEPPWHHNGPVNYLYADGRVDTVSEKDPKYRHLVAQITKRMTEKK